MDSSECLTESNHFSYLHVVVSERNFELAKLGLERLIAFYKGMQERSDRILYVCLGDYCDAWLKVRDFRFLRMDYRHQLLIPPSHDLEYPQDSPGDRTALQEEIDLHLEMLMLDGFRQFCGAFYAPTSEIAFDFLNRAARAFYNALHTHTTARVSELHFFRRKLPDFIHLITGLGEYLESVIEKPETRSRDFLGSSLKNQPRFMAQIVPLTKVIDEGTSFHLHEFYNIFTLLHRFRGELSSLSHAESPTPKQPIPVNPHVKDLFYDRTIKEIISSFPIFNPLNSIHLSIFLAYLENKILGLRGILPIFFMIEFEQIRNVLEFITRKRTSRSPFDTPLMHFAGTNCINVKKNID